MTIENLVFFSNYLQWAGSAFILLSCLPLLKQRQTSIKIILFYSSSSILFQLAQQISMSYFGNQNLNQIGNGFVLFEATLLGLVFWVTVVENHVRTIIAILIGCYVFHYSIATFLFSSNSHSLIRFGRDLELIVLSIIYFYYLIKELPEDNLLQLPMFWICAAIIFFFSGTFILSLMLDYLVKVLGDDLNGFWAFRNFFRFGFCLLLTYAVWLDWRQLSKA